MKVPRVVYIAMQKDICVLQVARKVTQKDINAQLKVAVAMPKDTEVLHVITSMYREYITWNTKAPEQ